jgi:prepilin-type N-terminal cleavage/methylation domain-containing protein/prepilin-type processing-associated H-X9-DG protein
MGRAGRGFTLIELLVVVAIIAILAAMLFPVYEAATKRAESTTCAMNLRGLAMATSMYAEDYDGQLTPARISGPAATLGTCWDELLLPYHRNDSLYLCPADQMPTAASGCVCRKHSYGINEDVTMIGGYNGSALTLSEIRSPSRTLLYFEISGSLREFGSSYATHGLDRVEPRHHGGSNYAFVDGHARWYLSDQTTTPDNLWSP